MKHKICMVFVFVALISVSVVAQPAQLEDVVNLVHSGDVRALCHIDGELWIGTSGGLYRYDLGSDRFVDHFVVGDRLPSNSVRAIRAKGDSVLVGTDGGLSIFDGNATTIYTNHSNGGYDSLSFDLIRSIDLGNDDAIFLGTFGDGVGVMMPDDGYSFTREDSLLDDKVYGTVEVVIGRGEREMYFATSMGLCVYRDSAWVGFQAGAGIPRGEIRRIIAAGRDRFYLLVGVGGVFHFNSYRASRLSPLDVFDGDDVADLARDERGILWAAGRFGGIAVYQGGRWKRISESDPHVNSARWRCVYADGDGGVYFGSADGLIVSIRDNILRKLRVPEQLPSGSARSIVVSEKDVRFLSGPTVVRVGEDLSSLTVDETPPGLVSLALDGNGGLWAAGRWGIYKAVGVGGADPGGTGVIYNEFVHDISAADPSFTALCFDDAGRMWTATRAGNVYRYDGDLWLQMGEAGEIFGAPVDRLVPNGVHIWAVSRDGGVARLGGGRWTVFPPDSLGGGTVRDLAVSPAGAVIAATESRLWLYQDDTGKWRALGVSGAVAAGDSVPPFVAPPANTINRVAFDSDNNLYLATDGGLGVIRPGGVSWYGVRDGIGGTAVVDVQLEGAEAVWLGFRSDGLARISTKSLW